MQHPCLSLLHSHQHACWQARRQLELRGTVGAAASALPLAPASSLPRRAYPQRRSVTPAAQSLPALCPGPGAPPAGQRAGVGGGNSGGPGRSLQPTSPSAIGCRLPLALHRFAALGQLQTRMLLCAAHLHLFLHGCQQPLLALRPLLTLRRLLGLELRGVERCSLMGMQPACLREQATPLLSRGAAQPSQRSATHEGHAHSAPRTSCRRWPTPGGSSSRAPTRRNSQRRTSSSCAGSGGWEGAGEKAP